MNTKANQERLALQWLGIMRYYRLWMPIDLYYWPPEESWLERN